MINGSPTDNNATLFKQGAHSVLDGKVNIAAEYDTPDWSPDQAQTEMDQALTALGNKVRRRLRRQRRHRWRRHRRHEGRRHRRHGHPVTGQDAELAAIQRILLGEQYMTVYKAIKPEAEAAAVLAFDLATGATIPSTATNGATTNNQAAQVPSILLTPVSVTKDNIKSTVVADGFWSRADICTLNTRLPAPPRESESVV